MKYAHFTKKNPLVVPKGVEPHSQGDNSTKRPTGEPATAPHTKGPAIPSTTHAADNNGRYDNRNSVEPHSNESRRSA